VTSDGQRRLLEQSLGELAAARRHLDFSAERIRTLPADLKGIAEADLETAEAFTSRFARTVDLLVNRVLRTLDRVELKAPGTILDVVHGAEQRGFVASAAVLREFKDVRNEVAHDYAGTRLPELFAFCRARKPELDEICDRVRAYVSRLPL